MTELARRCERVNCNIERMGEALSALSERMRVSDFIHCDSDPIKDANFAAYQAVGKAWDKLTASVYAALRAGGENG